jgi:hypothetical protein
MLDFPQPLFIKFSNIFTTRTDKSNNFVFLHINTYSFEHLNILLGGIVELHILDHNLVLMLFCNLIIRFLI